MPETLRYDLFTDRLLQVYKALTLKRIIDRKKTFSDAACVSQAYFAQVELRIRNFPKDEEKRSRAITNLFDQFSVRPDFMTGKTDKIFLKEPEPLPEVKPLSNVEFEFHAKHQKVDLLKKIQELEAIIIEKDRVIKELQLTVKRLQKGLKK